MDDLAKASGVTNEERADRGAQVIDSYCDAQSGDNYRDCALQDILADLMHYCAREKIDFWLALQTGQMHFKAEM